MEAWRGGNRKDRPEAGFFQGERKNGVSGTEDGRPAAVSCGTGHNRNDLAETMLPSPGQEEQVFCGLAGIRPCGDGIIRPVLCLERREIVNYLKEKGISYITDSTNLSDEYTRNQDPPSCFACHGEGNQSKSSGTYGRNSQDAGSGRPLSFGKRQPAFIRM